MSESESNKIDLLPLSAKIIVLLCLAPVLVKAPLLLGAFIPDPLLYYGNMALGMHHGPYSGFPAPFPTIDPNIAFTSHALGHRAAVDFLHGVLPWWNPYEGVGMPLAGEMQAAAFFPLTWLLFLKDGQLYMHIALQIIAGVSTYALLRRMRVGHIGALGAGLAFQFNGTFAWLANAVINPIPFLPLTLLGVEAALQRASAGQRGGAGWVAIGLSLSLYSGFPEVAYLNGLLILCWIGVRTLSIPASRRLRFLTSVAVAGIQGLAISAPILIAFLGYLRLGFTGGHEGADMLARALPDGFQITTLIPYLFGGIFGNLHNQPQAVFWSNIGGYAGVVLVFLAIYSLLGREGRALRIMLAAWVIGTFWAMYGIAYIHPLLSIIPGIKLIAFYRYFPPSWEFALCVLAALGLNDLLTDVRSGRQWMALGVTILLILAGFATMRRAGLTPDGHYQEYGVAVAIVVVAVIAALIAANCSARKRALGFVVMLTVEAAIYFAIPTFRYPTSGQPDLAGIAFLQSHIGMQRFYTLGPVAPNYGSYFGIASINHNDLPVPRIWKDYLVSRLDENANPIAFTGADRDDPTGPSGQVALLKNLRNFLAVGTRYVLTWPDAPLPAEASIDGKSVAFREAYADSTMRIYELDGYRPYVDAGNCSLRAASRNQIYADCAQPSVLIRLELFMPGWSARVNGQKATVTQDSAIFQAVTLPAGKSKIEYAYQPPGIIWGWVLFALGWCGWFASAVRGRRSSPVGLRALSN
ncbi:hypothetical protein [Paraburkholderia sp. Ac-20347]|uniref:hypothetical protein n=1 Tax=Paraburkholderia sp. Ac-20347 TaxID=2703892 RepID=UPI00197CE819|nr:hypothetical protein [Paraburkholderia sp. Ac-20347]MBN3808177.1 YfhO family protein [Paraburkholderia sp. Ac-20347]